MLNPPGVVVNNLVRASNAVLTAAVLFAAVPSQLPAPVGACGDAATALLLGFHTPNGTCTRRARGEGPEKEKLGIHQSPLLGDLAEKGHTWTKNTLRRTTLAPLDINTLPCAFVGINGRTVV